MKIAPPVATLGYATTQMQPSALRLQYMADLVQQVTEAYPRHLLGEVCAALLQDGWTRAQVNDFVRCWAIVGTSASEDWALDELGVPPSASAVV